MWKKRWREIIKGKKTVKSSVPYIGFFTPNECAEKQTGERTLKQAQALPLVLALRPHTQKAFQKELSPRLWST